MSNLFNPFGPSEYKPIIKEILEDIANEFPGENDETIADRINNLPNQEIHITASRVEEWRTTGRTFPGLSFNLVVSFYNSDQNRFGVFTKKYKKFLQYCLTQLSFPIEENRTIAEYNGFPHYTLLEGWTSPGKIDNKLSS